MPLYHIIAPNLMYTAPDVPSVDLTPHYSNNSRALIKTITVSNSCCEFCVIL